MPPIICLSGARWRTPWPALAFVALVLVVYPAVPGYGERTYQPENTFIGRVDAPEADVLRAVQEVTDDQIIHGTYSFDKERTLYGARAANSAPVFGAWNEPGKSFYKIADKVLAPRFFKDTEDIGTISIRYVVQPIDANSTSLRIDAVFVDARNQKHISKGSVEAAEFAAIQQRVHAIQAEQKSNEQAAQDIAVQRSEKAPAKGPHFSSAQLGDSWALGLTVPELERRVSELRHEAELQVKEGGASLRAAPFHASTVLASLPGKTEVAVVVLTPYWYGVQTEDGHSGWIHRSELEPLE